MAVPAPPRQRGFYPCGLDKKRRVRKPVGLRGENSVVSVRHLLHLIFVTSKNMPPHAVATPAFSYGTVSINPALRAPPGLPFCDFSLELSLFEGEDKNENLQGL
jgi:hypothetical protein